MAHPILKIAARAARMLPGPVRSTLYRLGPVTRWLRSTLTRAAPDGLSEIEVAAGPAAGYKMILDLQAEKDSWLGTYEPQLQQALADFTGPGMILYDIGANIGTVSLMMAAVLKRQGRIFAFEALPENVDRLRENIRINDLADIITVTHAAVIDREREVLFARGPSHATGRAVEDCPEDSPEDRPESMRLPGLSIDHFVGRLGNPAPDLIKIDIEGGEILALPGMAETLQRTRPIVLIELHGPEAAAAAFDFFIKAGYRMHLMRPAYPAVEAPADIDPRAYLVAQPDVPR